MKQDYPLTEKEIQIYRTLYYDHYKALAKEGMDESMIRLKMKNILNYYDWSWRRFEDYRSIDFMQRLVFEHSDAYIKNGLSNKPLTSYEEYRQYDPNYGALRLKDKDKTEDPDQFN